MKDGPAVVWFVVLILAAVALGARAGNAPTRSRKLGGWALAAGVAGFAPAILGPGFKTADQMSDLATCGALTILLAVAAVVLAVWTLLARRRDPSVAPAAPVAALAFGVANLFCGAGLFVTGSGALAPVGGVPSVWKSEVDGFEVTIPSDRWERKPNPNVLAEFSCARPALAAVVASARPAGSDAEYEAVLAYGRRVKADTPTTNGDERSGPNRHGHRHWLYMGDAKSGNTPYFFGISITRVGEKAVIMMFEGPYRLTTESGRAQEARSLRAQADEFLGSVK